MTGSNEIISEIIDTLPEFVALEVASASTLSGIDRIGIDCSVEQ